MAIQDILQTEFTSDYLPKIIYDLKIIQNLSDLNIDEISDNINQKIEKYNLNIENIEKDS